MLTENLIRDNRTVIFVMGLPNYLEDSSFAILFKLAAIKIMKR